MVVTDCSQIKLFNLLIDAINAIIDQFINLLKIIISFIFMYLGGWGGGRAPMGIRHPKHIRNVLNLTAHTLPSDH